MPSKFIFDPTFEGKLKKQPGLADALEKESDSLVEIAQGIATRAPFEESGDYHDGIKTVRRGDRVYFTAVDWKSLLIEFGTNDTPIFAPLRRALSQSGLRYKMTKRKGK